METVINKWGNSLAIRLPFKAALALGLKKDARVSLTIEDGKMLIAPVSPKYDLAEMLGAITPENCYGESRDSARGAEIVEW